MTENVHRQQIQTGTDVMDGTLKRDPEQQPGRSARARMIEAHVVVGDLPPAMSFVVLLTHSESAES
ncbi:hypothetical protein OG758_11775 [Streptomyces sp. NBC_01474]|uniref:hypothetical protein n=1 Tax=unclassified Streptomyces TaxID=2593676 RepID=UPI002DD9AFD4|nr:MULTISPECIES: hypothetical protein [unclassified Streptomyces]WSD94760.1 hypothetical protein OG758_11775 [Streptomyces sp. NBC_01474]